MNDLLGPLNYVADAALSLDTGDQPAPINPAPGQECASSYGGDHWLTPWAFDRYSPFFRPRTLRELRIMAQCPPIRSSLNVFKSTVLSGGFQLTPAIEPSEDGKDDPDQELALTILEECKRAKEAMERPLEDWAWEMMEAMAERHKVSEIVLGVVESGPDKGKYGIPALKVLPRWNNRFRVDRSMNVTAIDCYTVDGKWEPIDPRHFAWMSWEPRESDPRGTTPLDGCYQAFDMLQRIWPEFYNGNKQFGTPRTFGTTGSTADGCARMVQPRDSRGREIPGAKAVPSEYAFSYQLSLANANGAVVVGGPGYTAKVLESQRDGVGMNAAIQLLEAQIVTMLLLTTRATREAQFGSKADSETQTGVMTTFAQAKRTAMCRVARKPFRAMVEANYNADVAGRLTPKVTLGKIDPRSFAAICQAVGLLYQSGYFTEAQMLWLDEYLGLPIRRHGDARIGPQKDNAGSNPAADNPAVLAMFSELKTLMVERGCAA